MKTTPIFRFALVSLIILAGCHRKDDAAAATDKTDQASAPAASAASADVAASDPAPSASATPAPATDPASAPAAPQLAVNAAQFKWPRTYKDDTATIMVYQPAIEKWDGFNFQARFAVSIQEASAPAPTFGVVWLTANSNVNKDEGMVTLTNLAISKVNFPTEPNNAQKYMAFLKTKIPAQSMPIPLAQISNKYLLNQALKKVAAQPVKNTPPNIIFSDEPALLVLISGDPVMRPLPGTDCNYVFNTSSLIVQNAANGGPFYLRALNYWFKSDTVQGPWEMDPDAPARLSAVYDAALSMNHFDMINPSKGSTPPAPDVYVSTVPAELLQSDGPPSFVPINNTQLLEVKNSDNAIILNIGNQLYYALISGRWFSSPALTGQPWSFVPGDKLPPDFAKIPPNSDKGAVLTSVPGTPQAEEAVIANSIPQTATVNRQGVNLTVSYDDNTPKFAPVAGTSLEYAINTPTAVIQVNPTSFYAVSNGVWFNAASPMGPWVVATAVPPVIYTIPVASPIHYVTYVQVYGFTDSVVYVGYTPGYYGTVVAPGGVVVYGSGYVYPPYIGTTVYVAPPPTYGYGAAVTDSAATGFLFGFAAGVALDACCSPTWGCWGGSTTVNNYYGSNMYNSYGTHAVSGPVYGPHGGTGYASASYNPYTGNYNASRSGSNYNSHTGTSASGSESISGNAYSGNYDASRQGSAHNSETGGSASGHTSVSGNAYNGNWNANQNRSYNNSQTGAHASSSTTASGNVDNGTYHSTTNRSGTTANGSTASGTTTDNNGTTTHEGSSYNAKTGQSQSWDHTSGEGVQNPPSSSSSSNHMYSDSSGNVYKPSSSSSSGYQKASSSGWQDADHSQSQDLNRQSQGWGGDSGGGSRWGGGGDSGGGGDRWGGGGGGGGRFGGGGGGGGGRWGGGGGGRSWR